LVDLHAGGLYLIKNKTLFAALADFLKEFIMQQAIIATIIW